MTIGNIIQNDGKKSVVLVKNTKSGSVDVLRPGKIFLGYQLIEIQNRALLMRKAGKDFLIFQDKFAKEVRDTNFIGGLSQSTSGAQQIPAGPSPALLETYSEPGFERKAGKVTISQGYRDQLVNRDLGKILMQATAEPHIQNGRIAGFKLTQIDEDSIFSKSGFRNEDIITAINGKNLSNIATAINILKSLKNSEFVEFDVMRGGSRETISLTVQ